LVKYSLTIFTWLCNYSFFCENFTDLNYHSVLGLRKIWLGDSKKASKILDLLSAVMTDPIQGIGKLEPLKYMEADFWSRRIDLEHRLVYLVTQVASYSYFVPVLVCLAIGGKQKLQFFCRNLRNVKQKLGIFTSSQ
jgi:Txe/YoeB family toxin of toxin-antitoxin system